METTLKPVHGNVARLYCLHRIIISQRGLIECHLLKKCLTVPPSSLIAQTAPDVSQRPPADSAPPEVERTQHNETDSVSTGTCSYGICDSSFGSCWASKRQSRIPHRSRKVRPISARFRVLSSLITVVVVLFSISFSPSPTSFFVSQTKFAVSCLTTAESSGGVPCRAERCHSRDDLKCIVVFDLAPFRCFPSVPLERHLHAHLNATCFWDLKPTHSPIHILSLRRVISASTFCRMLMRIGNFGCATWNVLLRLRWNASEWLFVRSPASNWHHNAGPIRFSQKRS